MRAQLNMPQGVTPISQDLYDLHMTVIAICAVIGLIVSLLVRRMVVRNGGVAFSTLPGREKAHGLFVGY